MGIGDSSHDLFLNLKPTEAFQIVQIAGGKIGKVLETNPTTNTLVIRTRYGLNHVKLRVSLIPQDEGTLTRIQGAAGDIWGGGARKGADKLVKAIEGTVTAT